MYQYPMLRKASNWLVNGILAAAIVLALIALVAFVSIAIDLYRFVHPWAGHVFVGIVVLTLLYLATKLALHWMDHQTLTAGGFAPPDQASFRAKKEYCRYLILYIKRLAEHTALTDDQVRDLRKHVNDIEQVLGAHPLQDDLLRAIQTAEHDVIANALTSLGEQRQRITLDKMQAVIEDIHQPPFPVIKPVVMIYHQITLISQIVDLYVARPSMLEYVRVIRDVWNVMTQGDFIRLGQRLFEGVYVNSPPLGRASDDLGEAIAAMWITQSISNAAAHRCCVIQGWKIRDAIDWMDEQTIPSLHAVRDMLLSEVLPLMRVRIRHTAPWGTQDTTEFTDALIGGITRAVENVIKGLTQEASPPRDAAKAPVIAKPKPLNASLFSNSALPTGASPASEPGHHPSPSHRRRRRRRRDRSRIWHLITQRFRYRRSS